MKRVSAVDLTKVELRNGKWYAFELDGRRFFATVQFNTGTGFLELTEIPDPWICVVCGESYEDGPHGVRRVELHEFKPRGAPDA